MAEPRMPIPTQLPTISTAMTIRSAARAYLETGLHPVPVCRPAPASPSGCSAHWHARWNGHAGSGVGKTPLLRVWAGGSLRHAETEGVSPAEVGRMPWSGANIALCLAPSALVVVDLDSPGAVAEAGDLGLPETAVVRRGEHAHWYYRLPAGVPAARAIRRGESSHIDVLAAGYVLAPPSRHASGDQYTQVSSGPLATLPDWAARWLQAAAVRQATERRAVPSGPMMDEREVLDVLWRHLVPAWAVERIRAGDRRGDRSRTDWAVTATLVEHGVPDGVIAAIYRHPTWGIGAKYRERHDPDAYLGAMLAIHHRRGAAVAPGLHRSRPSRVVHLPPTP